MSDIVSIEEQIAAVRRVAFREREAVRNDDGLSWLRTKDAIALSDVLLRLESDRYGALAERKRIVALLRAEAEVQFSLAPGYVIEHAQAICTTLRSIADRLEEKDAP